MNLKLGASYNSALNEMMSGHNQSVLDYIKSIRSAASVSFETMMEQKALSFRLALKNNSEAIDVSTLSCNGIVSPDLKGDVHSVRGMFFMHQNEFENAQKEFLSSSECHSVYDNYDKALLARFNYILAKAFLSSEDLSGDFETLHQEALDHHVLRVQALCLRQLSNICFDNENFIKAEKQAQAAADLFAKLGVLSDLHLAYIHLADCLIEIGKIKLAKDVISKIPAEVDSRVAFPLSYIQSKIFARHLDLSAFDNINPYWLKRFRKYSGNSLKKNESKSWRFIARSGMIYDKSGTLKGRIKINSLEGQLLKILKNGPKNRNMLCESLWPDHAEDGVLESRFYRLVNRINHKLGELVVFDGKKYSLKETLDIRN
ncbi:hypothetical protein B9G69_013675 [Bdellovibrio sp. SKB1291214]|uniref:hypothetical protein n=1 Tax=Bdellovibrio sp. SKB1291214 TaxID=1732569 RepID=UPI000B51B27A|nr:hypothetical protein [Bdellovibrio sp. SKB1291214]UYL08095.1 hypothetical protein B9G69_013675 [Bdellovibrio sp. SKB1291214]